MNRYKFHLFITPTYYEKSFEYGLFGVGRTQMDQIANVHKGDFVFIYTSEKIGSRTRPFIYGPFKAVSEPFFNDELVWAKGENGKDKYPYRVKIDTTSEHICEKPISAQKLYDLREEGRIKSVIDSSALTNKSVINLLPSEGKLILESLIQQNSKGSLKGSPKKGHAEIENQFDPKEFLGEDIKEFRLESQLETYLLQNQDELNSLTQFVIGDKSHYFADIYNQVSTYIAGGAIDIIVVYEKHLFDMWLKLGVGVFELKKGVLEADTIDQLIEYIEWVARLFPGIKKEMIQGVVVGRDFGSQESRKTEIIGKLHDYNRLYNIICHTYLVDSSNDVHFSKLLL
jgi:predicted RNA-binding protein